MKYKVEAGGKSFEVEVDGGRVLLDGRAVDARLGGARGAAIRRFHRGREAHALIAAPGDSRGAWVLSMGGCRIGVQVLDPRDLAVRESGGRAGSAAGSGVLKAPMPGLVVRILVPEGAEVEAGQGLVVLEAMKMENQLKAPGKGVVKKLHVAPGDKVEKGAVLVTLG